MKLFSFLNLLAIYISVANFSETQAAKILFFHVAATASHRTSIWPLATKLADSGHNVTYIFPLAKRPGSHPLIEEIEPSKMLQSVADFVGDFDINIRLNNTVNEWLAKGFGIVFEWCEAFYDSPEVHAWLARPNLHFDLIMLDGAFGQCVYPLVHKFKAKHVMFNTVTTPFHWDSFGILPESSSIPGFLLNQKARDLQSSVWSRVLNTLEPYIGRLAYLWSIGKMERMVNEKLNMTDMPSFAEIEEQTSLVLHNTHFIEDYPMSLPPFYVSYSGLQCTEKDIKERNPLPKELEAFVSDNSTEGFVYVSLGSAVDAAAMPEALRDRIFQAFASFPNLKFLWRWTKAVPKNTPKNLLLQKWFPQLDLLNHPRLKAFITQCGRPSVQEALCYGVPMITLPIFGDQDFNADRLENIGASITLEITTLTADKLQNAIQEIVYNDKYKKRVTKLSAMFRDRPMDPVENAKYWVEYVLRHDTSLMKPLAMNQTWWQRRLFDVYAIIISIVLIFILSMFTIGYFAVKTLLWYFGLCRSNKKVKLN